jgi:hypothetical protein
MSFARNLAGDSERAYLVNFHDWIVALRTGPVRPLTPANRIPVQPRQPGRISNDCSVLNTQLSPPVAGRYVVTSWPLRRDIASSSGDRPQTTLPTGESG